MDWEAKLEQARSDHAARAEALGTTGARADLELAAVAGASWAAGLSLLMLGRAGEARETLRVAADEYVVSWDTAPAGSWGRPIAALRCRLMARDSEGAATDAEQALEEGAAAAEGPFACYAATLAELVLGNDEAAALLAGELIEADDFLLPVAESVQAVAKADESSYRRSVRAVLASFEERDAFLEGVEVADTVIVLEELARERGLTAPLESPLLPPDHGATPVRDM